LKLDRPLEQVLLNNDYEAARGLLMIPSQSGKYRRKIKVVTTWDRSTAKIERRERHEHAGIIFMPGWKKPGVERPGSHPIADERDIGVIIKRIAAGPDDQLVIGGAPIESWRLQARLIAKMAHSYWVAENGIGIGHFVLPRFVLDPEAGGVLRFVGGAFVPKPDGSGEKPHGGGTSDLHHIVAKTVRRGGVLWGYVDISLFSPWLPVSAYRAYVCWRAL